MPTCRRKRVVLTEPSEALLQAASSDPSRDVYYLKQTGEIFETYEYVPRSHVLTLDSPVPFQGVCCPYVILPSQAIPVRGHRKEWAGLFPGRGE